jgi:dienelactone hydrolase
MTPTGQVKTSFPGATDVFAMNRRLAEQLRGKRNPTPEGVRQRVRELTYYSPHAGPLAITSYGEVTRPACRAEKITYQSEPGISIPALLFVPRNGPARKPAIIFADARGKSAAASEAEQLAAKGYIVLAPDLRGFGETAPPLDRREYFVRAFGDYENTLTALLIGKTMPGMRALDVTAGVDLLAARNDVDSSHISAVGRAGAALPALFAALFDNRIARLALDGMLVSYESVVTERMNQGIVQQIVPSALKYFDLPDVVMAIAPRKVGIYNAVNPLGQELTLSHLRAGYARVGAAVGVRDREEEPFVPILERFLTF